MRAWVVFAVVLASSGVAMADGPVAQWVTVEVVDTSHALKHETVYAGLESTQKAMNDCIQAGQHTTAIAWLAVDKEGRVVEAKVESDPAPAAPCLKQAFEGIVLVAKPTDHAAVMVRMELSGLKEGVGYDPKPLPPPQLPPWSSGQVKAVID